MIRFFAKLIFFPLAFLWGVLVGLIAHGGK